MLVVVGAVALFQYFQYQDLHEEGARLDREIQRLQQEKAELAQVKTEYDTNMQRKEMLERRINIIEDLKERQTGPVQLLTVLASTVSGTDAVWLTGFEQTGRQVTIEGISLNVKAVADFLTLLKNTGMFAEMDLQETYQETRAETVDTFVFTFSGQLAASPLTSPEPGATEATT